MEVSVNVRTVLHEQAIRLDRNGLAAPLSAKIFEGRVAKTHGPADPLNYATGPEHRDLAEVESIVGQLVGTPVTLLHPNGFIRDGFEAQIIGTVTGARIDGEHAVATILIHDAAALAAIEDGIVELSLGYTCRLDETGFQRGITLDHLALVPTARCGASCALRTDCKNAATPCTACNSRAMLHTAETQMAVTKDTVMDELQKQLTAALAEVAAITARADQADQALAAAKVAAEELAVATKLATDNLGADLAKALASVTVEKTRADEATEAAKLAVEKARTDAVDSQNAAVKARVALLTAVKTVGIEIENLDAATEHDIKAAIVKHVDGIEVAADAPPLYVNGMFDGAMRRFDAAAASQAAVRTTIEAPRQDDAPIDTNSQKAEEAARAASAARRNTRWNSKKDQE